MNVEIGIFTLDSMSSSFSDKLMIFLSLIYWFCEKSENCMFYDPRLFVKNAYPSKDLKSSPCYYGHTQYQMVLEEP